MALALFARFTGENSGTKKTRSIRTQVARVLSCLTVLGDDMTWWQDEVEELNNAVSARDCCLHLSSYGPLGTGGRGEGVGGAGAAGGMGFPIPVPLGLFGGGARD